VALSYGDDMTSGSRLTIGVRAVALLIALLAAPSFADRAAVRGLTAMPAGSGAAGRAGAPERLHQLRGGGSMLDWWRRVLQSTMASLGIWSKKGQLLVIGLDNAGKSTLLTMLVRSKVVQHEPTHQPVSDEIRVGSLKLRAVDMGGHAIARRMWREYSKEADAVVYIVDAADRDRFAEAALELHKLLAGSLPPHVPVLLLGNKVDLPNAVREEEIYFALGLDELQAAGPQAQQRPLRLFMCSVFQGTGFTEGLEWLASCVK